MKKIIIITIILTTILIKLDSAQLVQATNNEATPEASNSSSIKDIKNIIKKNIENSKVKGAIDNLLNRKIAMIGEISRITDETITIKTLHGTKILPLDNNPQILKNKKRIKVEKVEVGNWVMVLGKLKNDNFSPSYIFVYNKTLRPKDQVVLLGTIVEITNQEITVNPRTNSETKTIKLTKNTKYQNFNGEKISAKKFSKDINILVTATKDNKTTTVLTIRSLVEL